MITQSEEDVARGQRRDRAGEQQPRPEPGRPVPPHAIKDRQTAARTQKDPLDRPRHVLLSTRAVAVCPRRHIRYATAYRKRSSSLRVRELASEISGHTPKIGRQSNTSAITRRFAAPPCAV